MLNNKRKYFLYTHLFLLVSNSKTYECIFKIKIDSLVIYWIWLFRMIDNLIFDLMKQIWINLELYLKLMNFLIFKDFFKNFSKFFYEFNLIYFELSE